MLDWIIKEYNYPVEEIIAVAEEIYNDWDFDAAFSQSVKIAYESMIMIRDKLANDNYS